jgi:DNA polymerase-3 subunit delta'
MPFDRIRGQDGAVGTLVRALETGRIHHAYRFEGPAGVGKEMAAFALAQALVCTEPPPAGHAFGTGCGKCHACVRAVTFSPSPEVPLHPDVVLVERGLYPAAAIGRSRDETQDISVDQIRRLVLERAAFPPHEGRARVIIVRRAEELSTSAANALLKTLEEPHEGTHFVLLTSRGNELIDTIRSRTLLVRFAPLSDALVREILASKGIAPADAAAAADLAGGSASLALDLADPDASKEREAFVDAALCAIDAPDLVPSLGVAEMRDRDKDVLYERLAALAARLWRAARAAAETDPDTAARTAKRHAVVLRAMRELDRNAQPALLLESMLVRLRQVA